MRSPKLKSKSNEKIYNQAFQTKSTQKKLSDPVKQSYNPLENISCRTGDSGCATKHVSVIQRTGLFNSTNKNRRVQSLLGLQQQYGNRFVQRVIGQYRVQAKLKIGQPEDIYEQEADRLAEQVMHIPFVENKSHAGSASETGGSGLAVDKDMRLRTESALGVDLGDVRVYTDAKASKLANKLNAKAFTLGRHIVFGAGQYAPTTTEGRKLLAHELVHTVQQRRLSRSKIPLGIQAVSAADTCQQLEEQTPKGIESDSKVPLAAVSSTGGPLVQRTCAQHPDEKYYQTSNNYCRDTTITGWFHPGQRCYREIPKRSSYWDCPPGEHICFDSQGRCDDRSYDKVSPVESRNPDGTCNLHAYCSIQHWRVDVVPWLMREKVRRQMECMERCEKLPWYTRSFCMKGCFPEAVP